MSAAKRDVFTTGEAAKVAGVSHRTVDYWARTKLIVPSVADASGMGRTRLYNFDDLVALRVVRELREAGISTQRLRMVVRYLRKAGWPKPLTNCRLIAVGKDVGFARTCKDILSVFNKPGQGMFAFMLDFDNTVKEIKLEVKALRAVA